MIHFNLISSIGLIADIIGALLLFKFGLPSKTQIHGGSLLLVESTEDELKRTKHNKNLEKWAYIGLILILFGFIFQLIGTNIQC